MKAKLGNTIIDFWKISTSKPENEPWVLESFEKGQISWSGQFAMKTASKQQLIASGMTQKYSADQHNIGNEIKHLDWLGLYISPNKMSNAYPDTIYLVVNQVRIPAFGRLGEYLVLAPDDSLEVYSEKKFERDLKEF